MQSYSIKRRAGAEVLGTFWLVLGGCGSAVLAGMFVQGGVQLGIGFLGVALAFGLALLTGAYALGSISGAHFNPAVTVGLAAARRFPLAHVLPYVGAQVVGAILAGAVLYVIARGTPGFDVSSGFATNGFGALSPGGYGVGACFLAELVMTAVFVLVILAVTDAAATPGFAPLAIGLSLTLIHLVTIPVTNTSVNPARSTGVALFAGIDAIAQLWLFWVAPLLGGVVGASLYRAVHGKEIPVEEPRELQLQDTTV
jgi:aquaporin Z